MFEREKVLTTGCVNVQAANGYPGSASGGSGYTGISSWAYPSSRPAYDVELYLYADCSGTTRSTGVSTEANANPPNYCSNYHSGPLGTHTDQQGYSFDYPSSTGTALNDHTAAFRVLAMS